MRHVSRPGLLWHWFSIASRAGLFGHARAAAAKGCASGAHALDFGYHAMVLLVQECGQLMLWTLDTMVQECGQLMLLLLWQRTWDITPTYMYVGTDNHNFKN